MHWASFIFGGVVMWSAGALTSVMYFEIKHYLRLLRSSDSCTMTYSLDILDRAFYMLLNTAFCLLLWPLALRLDAVHDVQQRY